MKDQTLASIVFEHFCKKNKQTKQNKNKYKYIYIYNNKSIIEGYLKNEIL